MKRWPILFLLIFVCVVSLRAASRTSADYSISAEGYDSAGAVLSSANYSVKGSSAGMIATLNSVVSPSITNKSGYVGQLYDVQGLSVTANPASVNETLTTQLSAAPLLDDLTTLAAVDPTTVSWSIASGPIASISSSGVATTSHVYQDTGATASGMYQSNSGQGSFTVVNVGTDDYQSYGGDGIDDSWQVQYFGQPPNPLAGPNADADGTGQTNLFKFIAGLNPVDGSRFALAIQGVNGQPTQKNLIFNPLVSGRTYIVQFTPSLATPSWQTLTGTSQSDNGSQRTVTDLNATGTTKFYRVQISKP
jgi:hypothetical protein